MGVSDDLDAALLILGLDRGVDAPALRRRYRERLKDTHPDRGGDGSVQEVLHAYRMIADALQDTGMLPPSIPVTPPSAAVAQRDEALVLEVSPHELFFRLHAALDELGTVIYADPDGGQLEGLVTMDGHGPGQLVATVLAGDDETQVLFTLESLDQRPGPPIDLVVRHLASLLST